MPAINHICEVCRAVNRRPGRLISAIASELGISNVTVRRQVERLVMAGLVVTDQRTNGYAGMRIYPA